MVNMFRCDLEATLSTQLAPCQRSVYMSSRLEAPLSKVQKIYTFFNVFFLKDHITSLYRWRTPQSVNMSQRRNNVTRSPWKYCHTKFGEFLKRFYQIFFSLEKVAYLLLYVLLICSSCKKYKCQINLLTDCVHISVLFPTDSHLLIIPSLLFTTIVFLVHYIYWYEHFY